MLPSRVCIIIHKLYFEKFIFNRQQCRIVLTLLKDKPSTFRQYPKTNAKCVKQIQENVYI